VWELKGELQGTDGVKEKTRENGLFLSRAAEMNVEPVKELFLWFRKRLWPLNLSQPPDVLMQRTASRVAEKAVFRAQVERLVRDADFGIEGLYATRGRPLLEDAPKEIREVFVQLQEAFRHSQPDTADELFERYAVRTRHRLRDSDDTVEFDLATDESNGTQRFIALVSPILGALENGNTIVVDELDCSMHPLLTYKLLELFQSEEANPRGAQLVFSTHDSNLMKHALFRRDQIYLTEKKPTAETVLFSLADFTPAPRKDEAFEKNYLSGRYGAVPNFGPSFEDWEIQ
jgi:hypothetical protein